MSQQPVATDAAEQEKLPTTSGMKGVTPRMNKKGKHDGKYQARVYDSIETKKQRGLGSFSSKEAAAAAVVAAEAQLKAGISPWSAPARANKYKRGEAPQSQRKKKKMQEVPLNSVLLPSTVEEIRDPAMAAFFAARSGEDL